jgi:hypothetical protein
VFYLNYILLAKTNNVNEISEYLKKYNIGTPDEEKEDIAENIIETYNAIR